jgi:hypothetical protein
MYNRACSRLLSVLILIGIPALQAATFTVTTTADSGAGSLRQAILDANANVGGDVIEFNVLPGGEQTIAPTSTTGELPTITDPLTIDGTTQPGFSGKAVIEIAGTSMVSAGNGLRLTTSNSVIRGLAINRFQGHGLEISGGGNNVVEGCIIGLDLAGATDNGNTLSGVFITNSSGNRIGGGTVEARNIISGNDEAGVLIEGDGAEHNMVIGNYIGTDIEGLIDVGNNGGGVRIHLAGNNTIGRGSGKGNLISGNGSDGVAIAGATAVNNVILGNSIGVDATGAGALSNSGHGVQITLDASGNTIGSEAPGQGNMIAFNGGDAIYIFSGTNNTIRANSMFSNVGQGIDLAPNGVNSNDSLDGDIGPNQRQNYPILTSAIVNANDTVVAGSLLSTPAAVFNVDFYSLNSPDASAGGEGQQYLGNIIANTDASGNLTFNVTLPTASTGKYITATATDDWGNTSEFSPNITADTTVMGSTFHVTTTADSGPGSLRQAILEANAVFGLNAIAFNIPGAGPQTISPLTALPAISNLVAIDGYTQPGASPNADPAAFNGAIQIVLDGASATSGFSGLNLQWPGSVVRGLNIINFKNGSSGIELGPATMNCAIEGCVIGMDLNNVSRPNSSAGISGGGKNNRIGGLNPAARNVISGNGRYGISLGGSENVIVGNNIGTTLNGLAKVANTLGGIELGAANNTVIGGTAPGARNVISGNNGEGIRVDQSYSTVIQGNYIGSDIHGNAGLPNASSGILLLISNRATVGGDVAGAANLIAFNGGNGVEVNGGTSNVIRGNSIHSNTRLGIDLYPNGPSPNDVGDGDQGSNGNQNFPLITSAMAHESTIDVGGTLNSRTNVTFTIDIYANAVADASGHGEGQQYLGSTTVTTDGDGNATFTVTLPAVIVGRFIAATATDPEGNTSEFSLTFQASTTFPAETFVVTNTSDSGPGSLRQAILDNNASRAGVNNSILFNIPGSGPHVIKTGGLDAINHPVTIDGFTQPGATPNTLTLGEDSILKIELTGDGPSQAGLDIRARGSIVRGISMTLFSPAINIVADGVQVAGCWIGLTPGGVVAGNDAAGIRIDGGSGAIVGGENRAERNIISGNNGCGVQISPGALNATVAGNYIGADPSSLVAMANRTAGILLEGANHTIGGVNESDGNLIAFNGQYGVAVSSIATNNAIRKNRIFNNGQLGIDLNGNGVTLNDVSDDDVGANQLQNFPVITAATLGLDDVQISGHLQSAASQAFDLDFFANSEIDPNGYGEGEQYLGSAVVNTGADGRGEFAVTFQKFAIGRHITATATDSNHNTSEFSADFRAESTRPPQTLTVTTDADSGPGSLRQALLDSGNFHSVGPNKIQFNIPGAGLHVINVLSELPRPIEPVEIDGFTQPGTTPNAASDADAAVRLIQIRGAALNGNEVGLLFDIPGNIVRGLIVSEFPGSGIFVHRGDNFVIEGSLVYSNRAEGILINNSVATLVGGSAPAARNTICGNADAGIAVTEFIDSLTADNRILGNFIGVDLSGAATMRVQPEGILINGPRRTQIGGLGAGEGNLIAFNGRGVIVQNGMQNSIRGNRIFGNNALGIDLAFNGPTQNDADDADTGPNGLQNFPLMQTANITAGGTHMAGTLNSAANSKFTVDFYSNDACDNSGYGEGARYMGETSVTTDASGAGNFDVVLSAVAPRGVVTATATDASGNTSEFSACVPVGTEIPPQTFVVLNTNDAGPGSLRQAILDANDAFTAGPNTIAFNIPETGLQVISPVTPLPAISAPVIVNGFTQPGAQPNSSLTAHDATILIRLDGANAGANADGLRIAVNNTTVRGLIVTRFNVGIHTVNAGNVTIAESYIGTTTPTAGNPAPASKKYPSAHGPGGLANQSGAVFDGGRVTLTQSVVAGNTAQGAVFNGGQLPLISNSVISGNGGTENLGGGILLLGPSNPTIEGSIIMGNLPNGVECDGAVTFSTQLAINHSTISENSLPNPLGFAPDAGGAGIYLHHGSIAQIADCTISQNNAAGIIIEHTLVGAGGSQGHIIGSTIQNNLGAGLALFDTFGVNIGGTGANEANHILDNQGGGIVIFEGTHNFFENNIVSFLNRPFFVGQLPSGLPTFTTTRTISGADISVQTAGKTTPDTTLIATFYEGVFNSPDLGSTVITPVQSGSVRSDSEGNFNAQAVIPGNGADSVFLSSLMHSFAGTTPFLPEKLEVPTNGGNVAFSLLGPGQTKVGEPATFHVVIRYGTPVSNPRASVYAVVPVPPGFEFVAAIPITERPNMTVIPTDESTGRFITIWGAIDVDHPAMVDLTFLPQQIEKVTLVAHGSVENFFGENSNTADDNPSLTVDVVELVTELKLRYIVNSTGAVSLIFDDDAVLASSPEITGPWQTTGQHSPFIVDTNSPRMFFRAVIP